MSDLSANLDHLLERVRALIERADEAPTLDALADVVQLSPSPFATCLSTPLWHEPG